MINKKSIVNGLTIYLVGFLFIYVISLYSDQVSKTTLVMLLGIIYLLFFNPFVVPVYDYALKTKYPSEYYYYFTYAFCVLLELYKIRWSFDLKLFTLFNALILLVA